MKQYSIRQYVAWLTLTPLLIITVSLESFFLHDDFSDMDHDLLESGKLIARQFASSSEYGVFANNQPFLQNIAQGVLQQPDVQGAIILDAASGVLIKVGDFSDQFSGMAKNEPTGKIMDLVNLQMPVYRSSDGLWIYQPIVPAQVELDEMNAKHEVQPTGAVIVKMSSVRTGQHKSQMLWLTVGLITLSLIFPFSLIYLGSRKITAPIRKLSDAIRALGDGRLETRVTTFAPVYELNTLTRGINDMAEKLQQEQVKLQQRAIKLTEAQRIAHLGNWEWDVVNNTVTWSDETYRIFGLAPQQSVATFETYIQAVHPDDRQYVENNIRESQELARPYSMEHRILLPDGTVRYVHERIEAVRNDEGRLVKLQGTTQDISERRQAEAALRQSEADLKTLVEHSPIAMVVDVGVDADEKIMMMNWKFTELFGYTMADVPDVLHWWQLAYPDEKYLEEVKAEWIAKVTKAIQSHGDIEPMETTVNCKDGSSRYVRFSIASTGSRNIIAFEDFTERKHAETRLNEQLTELRRWQDAMLGREMRILELKHEVNGLLVQAGEPARYPSAEAGVE